MMQVVVLVWLTLLTLGLFTTARAVAVLAKQALGRHEAAEEAKKMLRWGLEQRRGGGQNIYEDLVRRYPGHQDPVGNGGEHE